MHGLTRFAATLGVAALAVTGSATTTHAAAPSGVTGHVYVNDNTAGVNTIAAFDRHADGTLTPIPGSPFAAGGAGTGSGIGAQGAIQRSADGRYLLAVDAGSNQISVLRIRPDGALRPVEDSPVASNGVEPVSIAVHGNRVYVANAGDSGANYTGFRLNEGGHLRPLANSTFTLPAGSSPGDVLFSGDGAHLVGVRVGPSLIDSFVVGVAGRLTPAAGSPFAAQAAGPFGSAFRPSNPAQLFVSNAHAGPGNGSVSAFDVAGDGTLTAVSPTPFPDLQTAPCWLTISPDGQYVFTSNTASSTISRYNIAADGTLTLLGSTALGGGAARPVDLALDPSGSLLYVVDAGSDTVSGFGVSGGALSELPSSPFALPAGATPFGIVVD